MKNLFSVIAFCFLTRVLFAQSDMLTLEREAEQFARAQNWDQVMLRSLDMMTLEPLQAPGYYFTALALYKRTELDKADDMNKKAFLFGDEKWKTRSRELATQIEKLKKVIPVPVNLDDINSMKLGQWRDLWDMDKTNINAGINVVELALKQNLPLLAASILDDPAMAKQPGAAELRKKLGANKAVAADDKLDKLLQTANNYYDRKDWDAALSAYKKVLEEDKNNRQASERIDQVSDEISWRNAQKANTREAYETYLRLASYRRYGDQARAKVIDYLKREIDVFAKRGEVDKAEQSYMKYVEQFRPPAKDKQELEKKLCDLYFTNIYALSESKSRADKQERLKLYYKARKICELSEKDKKEITKLEKSLN